MIKAMVDTNVLLDYLARREPFYAPARKLMVFANMGDYDLWMSSSQVTDLSYLLSGGRRSEQMTANKAIMKLRGIVNVCSVGVEEVDRALESPWSDFENALVHQAAMSFGARCIITRDQADFTMSAIPTFDCTEFFEWFEEKERIHFEEVAF
jgi:predicted nucleic acid-binding protein